MTDGDLGATFGARVKLARERLGITQQQLSDRLRVLGLKVDTSAITRIEGGSRDPRLSEAQAIAHAFGIALLDLIPPPTDELVIANRLRELSVTEADLGAAVERYEAARQALGAALDELGADAAAVRDYDAMRAAADRRAIDVI